MLLSLKTKTLKILSKNAQLGAKQTQLIGGGTDYTAPNTDTVTQFAAPNTDTVTQFSAPNTDTVTRNNS
ncbi:hypothetical protein [Pseudoalteromonas luteoviolacea]|uniref:Uncharacterized protein n=1 Tax=Pseudoalteromonas luteoviolacea H33 TaxID=1365251 RepID=A0A167GC53_9GAMM|nr:hypothetical protein [Pseudoalteromonas luteoviolacea]KZN54874.1 hypothetical protein N476_07645 [Pseudoalteromonas luteoviolacea H33]KZN77044.1 hypothetical protein N477_13100 [Pseudoalteromonas luteoviolacea H33-S]MBQ4879736.1 hypothetical protein [Pseudoalteromonas luteoviolacea]MBQ4908798.1 hypothetical protein [Pseudoalteromonas luteoviolacea]